MGGESLRGCSCEPLTGKEAVSRDGRGARADRLRVGSRAQWDHSEDLVSPQGPGDGGTQGPDRWPSQGECRSADPSSGSGPEGEGGGGTSSGNGGGEVRVEVEREKWHTVSRKFFDFVGFSGDVVTKARLYDQCMKKPEATLAPKILRMLVDFNGRVENLLKELCVLLKHDR